MFKRSELACRLVHVRDGIMQVRLDSSERRTSGDLECLANVVDCLIEDIMSVS
jgi:hypothetical protein